MSFPCTDCDAVYVRREFLARHVRSKHTKEKPYICEGCSTAYGRSDLLLRHRKACPLVSAEDLAKRPAKKSKKQTTAPPSTAPEADSTAAVAGPSRTGSSTLDPLLNDQNTLASPSTGDISTGLSPFPSSWLPPLVESTSSSTDFNYVLPMMGASTNSLDSCNPPSLTSGSSGTSPASDSSPGSSMQASPPTATVGDPTLALGDPTLAPAMDGGYSAALWNWPQLDPKLLTQEELEASEVLEDLLRSPQMNAVSAGAGSSYLYGGGMSPTALTATSADFLNVAPGFGNELENSPEAQQLASYFHQGGVGGITALDLGFKYEPSLYPSHVINHTPPPLDSRWELPLEKFHISYQVTNNMPPYKKLVEFAKSSRKALPMSLIHESTVNLRNLVPHHAFAITVAGAAASPEGQCFADAMLSKKRKHIVQVFYSENAPWAERYAAVQSLLLYQIIGLGHVDPEQVNMARQYHPILIKLFRELDLLSYIQSAQKMDTLTWSSTGEELAAMWKRWLEVEEWRRVTYTILLTDIKMALKHNIPPAFSIGELTAHLPCDDKVWNSSSAEEWKSKYLSPRNGSKELSLPDAIQALLAAPTKEVGEFDFFKVVNPFGIDLPNTTNDPAITSVLGKIDQMQGSAILILTQTLDLLEKQTTSALAAINPFSSFLGVAGSGFGHASQARELQSLVDRIIAARARLSYVGKGADASKALPSPPPQPDYLRQAYELQQANGVPDWEAFDPITGEVPMLQKMPEPSINAAKVAEATVDLEAMFPSLFAPSPPPTSSSMGFFQ